MHACIADRRRDFLHKLTTRLIRENQVVCVESLSVKNMLQNHCLAKAIAEVGWGELVRQLQYKRTGMAVRWLPSTSSIRARNGAMPAGISWTPWIWMFASGPVLRVARSMIGTRTLR